MKLAIAQMVLGVISPSQGDIDILRSRGKHEKS